MTSIARRRPREPAEDTPGESAGGSAPAAAARKAAVAATDTAVPRRRPARSGQTARSLLPLELAPDHVRDNPHILNW